MNREEMAAIVLRWREAFPDLHTEVEDLVAQEDRVVGYSPRTRKVYASHLWSFLRWHGGAPAHASNADVRGYLVHLPREREVSRSYHAALPP